MELFTRNWGACIQNPIGADGKPSDPSGVGVATLPCVWVVIQNVINAAMVLSAVVALVLIMYSGYQYVTSNGDKEKVDAARKRLTYAIIGLVFILLTFTFINIFAQLTGVGLNQLTTPPQP